jgi:predicted transposase YdaD
MLGLNLKETRVYQDIQTEAEVKLVKAFAKKEIPIEEIMEDVEFLTLEEVQQIIQQVEDSAT